jgi:hypothetical protein
MISIKYTGLSAIMLNYSLIFLYHTLVIAQSIMLLIISSIAVLAEFSFFESATLFTVNLMIFIPVNVTIGLFHIYITLLRPISCKFLNIDSN